jgi:hypothetical protein
MGTGKQQTSLAVKALVVRVAQVIAQAGELELGIAQVLAAAESQAVVTDLEVAEQEIDLAAVELEHDLAEEELGIVRVEAVRERVPEAAEPLIALVEGELARDHPRAQPAAVPKIKSGIAAHLHGLVPLLAVAEDLAAVVAVTTHEPAAVGVATAWEVADIAVVVVEDAAAEG